MLQKTLYSLVLFSISSLSIAQPLKEGAWVGLPAIGSSPETGFQYGAYVMRIFPQTAAQAPQNRIELLLQGTSEGQYQAYIWPNLYFQQGLWQFKGTLGGRFWPSEYYGQGNHSVDISSSQTYTDTTLEGSLTINYQLSKSTSIGSSFFAENHDIAIDSGKENTGLLNDSVNGFAGGLYTGVGINASLDNRDNIDWPTAGQLMQVGFNWFDESLASEQNFSTWHVSSASYMPLGEYLLAASAQIKSASDKTPFTHLPRPQGDRSLRGANGNRWIAKSALGLQSEVRKPLSEKFAGVVFFDAFQVNNNFEKMRLSEFHTSLGGGVRYSMTPDRFNIRFDLGWVDFSSVGFALTVGEAF